MIDFIILLSAIGFSVTFLLFSVQRIFNFYIWIILGFFIFLSLYLELEILTYTPIDDSMSNILKQLYDNKEFYLTLATISIPIYWIVFFLFTSKGDRSMTISSIFWFLLPFLLVWILAFVWRVVDINFFVNNIISNVFIDSKIFDFFSNNLTLFFVLVFFLIFWKLFYLTGKILWYFIIWFSKNFYTRFLNKREEKKYQK